MKLVKRNVELNGWNLFTNENCMPRKALKDSAKCLVDACDHGLGFVITSQTGSFIAIELYELDHSKEVAKEYMNKVLSYHPDFNTTILTSGGCLLTMQDRCWQAIPSNKLETNFFGDITPNCTFKEREKLINSCEKSKILGILLPPEVSLDKTDFL